MGYTKHQVWVSASKYVEVKLDATSSDGSEVTVNFVENNLFFVRRSYFPLLVEST